MSEAVRKLLGEIIEKAAAGDVDAAEQMCRDALATNGEDVNLLGLLGAILMKKGCWDEAERTLKRTIDLAPAFARPHEDLGALYLARNAPERAVTHFRQALELDPAATSAKRGLAAALDRSGRREEAAGLLGRKVASSPDADALARAADLRRREDYAAAERLCEDILKRNPQHPGALRELAVIATEQERYVVAEGYLRRVLKIVPDHIGTLMDLGRFLGQRGRYPEAIEVATRATEIAADNPDAQLLCADMLAVVGRSTDALRCYRECLRLRPDDYRALLGSGHMLRIEGDPEGAEQAYRRCTELKPELGDAWWNLASLPGHAAGDDEIARMQEQLERSSTPAESVPAFHFALARAFERRRDFETAWQHYSLGNSSKRALVRYDPVETEVQQQKIRDTFTAELFTGAAAPVPAERTPVFVVGLPRSGSTLIEQILASHPRVTGGGELPYIVMLTNALAGKRGDGVVYPALVPDLSESELTGLGRSYLHHTESHVGADAAIFTDKMPANFAHVGFIRLILPHARIIDARRGAMATCVANYRQLFAQGKNQSYDLMELGEYYLQYATTMDHWDEVLPGAVLRVDYEDVVADLEGQVRRILDFCGLPFDAACVEFHRSDRPVNTASAEQVREPIYTTGVDFWKHYEPWLDELRDVLAPVL